MPSPDQITLIEQLKSQGKTLVEIAAAVGLEMGDVESVVDMAEVPLATGGGVTQILAGTGVSVSPSNGEGVVTLAATGTSTNTGASVLAGVAPSLPLTITADVNDQFVYTPAPTGVPETFTLTPSTYTTLTELIAVLNGRYPDPCALGTLTVQFADIVLASPESGKILLTSRAPGAVGNGDTITEGNGGAAALGFTANPDTFAGGLSAAVVSNPAVGARQSYTFVDDDAIDPSSWWANEAGGETSIRVWGQWTPEASGALELLSPPFTPDGYPESYWIFRGQTPNVEYPDGTADSAAFSGVPVVSVESGQGSAVAHINANDVCTIIVADSSGGSGETIDLGPLLNSLAAFGGLDQDPPPLPLGIDFVLSRTADGAPRWRPGPASGADALLADDLGRLTVAVHWGGGLLSQEAPVLSVSLLEDKLFPGHWHSISLIDFLSADDHVGPEIGGFPFSHALNDFQIAVWRFVVIRLDGTASININGGGSFTQTSDPTDISGAIPTYNVPSSLLNWAAPTAQSGTDLTGDADNHWIHTTAGGGMFIYTELILEVD